MLVRGESTLGRAEGCDVVLDDPRVSRRHARLLLEDGRLVVEDLGSPNGTVVNGLRVARQELSRGDVLVLGKHRLRVETGGAPRGDVVKPVRVAELPKAMGRHAIYRALGLGDETLLDAGPGAAVALLDKTRHYAVLHQLSLALRAAHTPKGMLGRLVELVLEFTEGDRGFVVLAESGASTTGTGTEDDTEPPGAPGDLRVAAVRGKGPGTPTLSSTVARHVLSERCSVLSHDPGDDARFAASESLFLSETRALMAVPILLREQVLGALVVESGRPDAFSESDLDLLTVLSTTIGQTLENLQLAERREATIRELEAARAHLLETRARLVRSEQLAAVGRLASGLAHEVKNHLSPFMLADMIARKYPDDEETQNVVELMLEARQHIVDLVSEVKGFARGPEGSGGRREPADLLALARAVARFVSCDAAVKRHRLEVVALGEPWARIDTPRIRQLLLNLVKNAADALGEAREGRIEVRVEEDGPIARLTVTDDGPGVPSELGERIFEPFVSTKGENGLGLGLDIARRIARDHGGELEFESEPGSTRFTLRLPALPE